MWLATSVAVRLGVGRLRLGLHPLRRACRCAEPGRAAAAAERAERRGSSRESRLSAAAGSARAGARRRALYRPLGDEVAVFEARRRASACRCCSRARRAAASRASCAHMAGACGRPSSPSRATTTSRRSRPGRTLARAGRRHDLAGRAADARPCAPAPSPTSTRSPRRARTRWSCCTRCPTIAALLPLERADEVLQAHPDFLLVVSFNPGYQSLAKELKPSTRQRFVALEFGFPPPEVEAEIVPPSPAWRGRRRSAGRAWPSACARCRARGLAEAPSTRLLVHAARLVAAGVAPRAACHVAIVAPLTDDPERGAHARRDRGRRARLRARWRRRTSSSTWPSARRTPLAASGAEG